MGAADAIVQGFRELLEILPYDKIAVYQICEKAGVSRKTFYVHFQNKASIVNRIVYDDVIAPLVKMNEVLPVVIDNDNMVSTLPPVLNESIYKAIYRDKEFFSRLCCHAGSLDSPFVDAFIVGVQDLNHKILDVVGYSIDPWERDYIAYFFSSSNALLIQRWIRSGMTVPPEKIAALYNRMSMSFWHGLIDKD
jgi:Transcriptional regulator